MSKLFPTAPVHSQILEILAVDPGLTVSQLGQRLKKKKQTQRSISVPTLYRVVADKLNTQIADELGVSELNVKSQRALLMDKLGAGSPAELGALVERLRNLPRA